MNYWAQCLKDERGRVVGKSLDKHSDQSDLQVRRRNLINWIYPVMVVIKLLLMLQVSFFPL